MLFFPSEFSELLTSHGKEVIATPAGRRGSHRPFLTLVDGIVDVAVARACAALLDTHLSPLLRPMVRPIPRNSISGMKTNYSEQLPKTMSMKTCSLQSRRHLAYAPAERMGLIDMLGSESLHRFAELATGVRLARGTHQAICYEHGDYAGPHNDHHPEQPSLKKGFVDLHIMFGNDAVDHQWIVYEQGGHLRRICNVNLQGGVAVYRLPFWHYTTPLAGKPGREAEARRWLLLVSYDILRHRGREISLDRPA